MHQGGRPQRLARRFAPQVTGGHPAKIAVNLTEG